MLEQTIMNQKESQKDYQNLSSLAENKLIEMSEQGDTQSLNLASNYTGLLSFPLLKELMIKKSLKTKLKFNVMEMKRNQFIKIWSTQIFIDANKYKYQNFGNVETNFFKAIRNVGIRNSKDRHNSLMNFENDKISFRKRIQYLGFITDIIKDKPQQYQVNYFFLIGIFEFGKHTKNILLNYNDDYEYFIDNYSDRFNILSINNWFYLEEELCHCNNRDYLGITYKNICSYCKNKIKESGNYMDKKNIIYCIKNRLKLKFSLILTK